MSSDFIMPKTSSQDGKAGAVKSQSPVDTDDTKSRIGDEYILVRKSVVKQPVDVKTSNPIGNGVIKYAAIGDPLRDIAPPPLLREGAATRSYKELVRASSSKRNGRANGPEIRVRLFGSLTAVNSGAGVGMGGAINFAPSVASEFTSYAALYDEVKVLGGRIRFAASDAVAGSTTPVRDWAVGYDPAYGTVPATTDSVVESTQHHRGFTSFGPFIGSGVKVIGAYEKNGQQVFDFKCPTSPVFTDPAALTTNFPGAWMNCGDPSDHAGYLRYYIGAPGGTTVTTLSYSLELDCLFRIRT